MMVIALIVVAQVAGAAAAQAVSSGCDDGEIRALAAAESMMHQGADPLGLEGGIFDSAEQGKRCDAVLLVRDALRGWNEARQLTAIGGDRSRLGPVMARIEALERLKRGPMPIEVDYAQVAIRAAIAAAQDERPELELLLTHARDLSERLAQRGGRMIWPRPFNLLAGELWLEVDRYEEARQAFVRAAAVEATPRALAGWSEALLRLERRDDACQIVSRVTSGTGAVLAAVDRVRAACR